MVDSSITKSSSTVQNTRHRKFWRELFKILLFTIFLFFVAEFMLRVFDTKRLEQELDGWEILDDENYWKPKPYFEQGGLKINHLGFRGDEIEMNKPPDVFRIVALGESTTFGNHKIVPYPTFLEKLLNSTRADNCSISYEVINAAVQGYSSDQVITRLKSDVLPLTPDLLFVYQGWNDLYAVDPENTYAITRTGGLGLKNLASQSQVVRYMLRFYYWKLRPTLRPTTQEMVSTYESFEPTIFEENMRQIIKISNSENIPIMLSTLPSALSENDSGYVDSIIHYPIYTMDIDLLILLWRKYNSVIRNLASERNISIIDLANTFELMDNEGQYFYDTLHIYEEAHIKIAHLVYEQFVQDELLPCHMK